MRKLKLPALQGYLGLLTITLVLIVGGAAATVRLTTDYLLNWAGTNQAQQWANFLAANVQDLELIASGETLSSASQTFFDAARKSEQVYRYVIFNRYGYSVLVADRKSVTPVDLSEFDPKAAQAIKEKRPIVEAHAGSAPDEPVYLAKAYIPVEVQSRPVATVVAYVDLTDEYHTFMQTFLVTATVLCLLTGLSFGIPAVGWYTRTQQKQQADRRIHFLAHHDVLTGLPNRATLTEALDAALATQAATGGLIAAHFIDIDHFKEINDTLGHDGGDFLLNTIAQRLSSVTRINDIVARIGGDEFIVIQTAITNKSQPLPFAQRITRTLSEPVSYKDQQIRTSATIGVALAPDDGRTSERLLKSADIALYRGKQDGRNCIRIFTPEMDEEMQARLRLEKLVRDATTDEKFVLHYQPIYELKTMRLIGFEALIRLPTPDKQLISPNTLIPVAEELRLMSKIGAWVLREACATAATWPDDLSVAVNLSPSQFDTHDLEENVALALRLSGLDAHRLELELTESTLLHDTDLVLATLRRLKENNIAIVLDDFGTGYSSLSYLWKFPFDKIKIDRSFMASFEAAGRDVEIVMKTIIALGREMKVPVVVEGAETENQVNFLFDTQANHVQGFYFGRPVPATEVSASILKDFRGGMPDPVAEAKAKRAIKAHEKQEGPAG